jgi:hypothetical protein
MTRRTGTGRHRPAAPGGMLPDTPLPGNWAEPGTVPGSQVPDWPWASAGDQALTRAGLRAGYGLRRRDIRRLEAAGLLAVRRTWSGRVRYTATSGWLPERPQRGTLPPARRPVPPARGGTVRPRVSPAGITLAAARGTGTALWMAAVVLCRLIGLLPWWVPLLACAVVSIVAGPHTIAFPVLLAVAAIRMVLGITRAVARPAMQPPPLRKGWW